jgi:hypothetical protein
MRVYDTFCVEDIANKVVVRLFLSRLTLQIIAEAGTAGWPAPHFSVTRYGRVTESNCGHDFPERDLWLGELNRDEIRRARSKMREYAEVPPGITNGDNFMEST